MTRQPHDQFAKSFLSDFLEPLGKVEVSLEVRDETRAVDLYFEPDPGQDAGSLGLLGRMVHTPCLIEPFRNAVRSPEIRNCLIKELVLQAKHERKLLDPSEVKPFLWILTPTISKKVVQSFGAKLDPDWAPGIYLLPSELRTGLVAIHQLPIDPSTLWIRLLGRGRVQTQAIAQVMQLPPQDPKRLNTLELLGNWKIMLDNKQEALKEEERELVMNLSPAYLEWREKTLDEGIQIGEQRGKQEGEVNLTLRQLRRRFGSVADAQVERIRALPVEQLESLGEALLDFTTEADLLNWLNEQV